MSNLQSSTTLILGRQLEKGNHWWRAARLYEKFIRDNGNADPKVNLRLAVCRMRTNKPELAINVLADLITDGHKSSEAYIALGEAQRASGKFKEATRSFEKALEYCNNSQNIRILHAESLIHAREPKTAVSFLENLNTENPDSPEITDLLALALNKSELRWRELEVLESQQLSRTGESQWSLRIAHAAFYLRKFELAGSNFEISYRNSNKSAKDSWMLYNAGLSFQRAGQVEKSNLLYQEFLSCQSGKKKKFGIGAYHEEKQQWVFALEAYRNFIPQELDKGELLYTCGRVAEKLYNWKLAREFYVQALSYELKLEDCQYRLGYVNDRLGDYELAAASYTLSAAFGSNNQAFRWFRAGYSFAKAKDYESSCDAYVRSCLAYGTLNREEAALVINESERDELVFKSLAFFDFITPGLRPNPGSSESTRLEYQADVLLRAGEFARAAESVEHSLFHRTGTKSSLFAKKGLALLGDRKYKDSSDSFARTRNFARPSGVDERPYLKGPQTRRHMIYNDFRESTEISNNTVLFESSHGSSIHCNPLAIYNTLKKDVAYQELKFVWVINDLKNTPQEILSCPRTMLVKQHSDEYLYHLACAKYLVNNATFPTYFIRRSGQRYLNTWHGTPLKLMGKRVKNAHFEHSNVVRNLLHSTHLFLPNEHTANALINDHDIDGLLTAEIVIGGSPRIDHSISASSSKIQAIRRLLGVFDDSKKIVLYAPTWRGQLGKQTFDNDALVKTLGKLVGDGHEVVFRAHRFAERAISGTDLPVSVVPPEIDTNELLSAVDVLITDYSSIFYDFLPLQRPIIFYTPDYDEYIEQRGVYFNQNEWPGEICWNEDELLGAVDDALHSGQKDYSEFFDFIKFEDGNASKRAIECFFDPNYEPNTMSSEKKSILIYQGSFIPNGITTSFVNLVNSIDTDSYDVYVAIDAKQIPVDGESHRILKSVSARVKFIARIGGQVLGPEERLVSDRFHKDSGLISVEENQIFSSAMKREFLRVFGYAKFDHVINFEGYSRFWASILANPINPETNKVIYLHNDMVKERDSRFPRMQGLFSLYGSYDRLVSVSKSVHDENQKKISEEFRLPVTKFVYADNLIDVQNPIEQAKISGSDLSYYFDDLSGAENVFVNMARLSPEKGHKKLIDAFAIVKAKYPQSRLLIIGDGPLRQSLEARTKRLGLSADIIFTGQLSNPFSLVAQSDCFVFSSEYEGQGLAMIESLILGTPVISTDVVGSRSVVENGLGMLVENTIDGLAAGMCKFIEGWVPQVAFDPELYYKNASYQFRTSVLGLDEKSPK